jgi:hypothetical protein
MVAGNVSIRVKALFKLSQLFDKGHGNIMANRSYSLSLLKEASDLGMPEAKKQYLNRI